MSNVNLLKIPDLISVDKVVEEPLKNEKYFNIRTSPIGSLLYY